jgi:hypothetical protein
MRNEEACAIFYATIKAPYAVKIRMNRPLFLRGRHTAKETPRRQRYGHDRCSTLFSHEDTLLFVLVYAGDHSATC